MVQHISPMALQTTCNPMLYDEDNQTIVSTAQTFYSSSYFYNLMESNSDNS